MRSLLLALTLAIPALSQEPNIDLNPLYGRVHHATSTNNPRAQEFFEQGLALYYGFNHDAAVKSFQAAAKEDPQMAMAWWGVAICLGPNYNADVDEAKEHDAFEAIEKALVLEASASDVEREYIEALRTRYTNQKIADYRPLSVNYAKAMQTLAAAHPNDNDARVLYAESLMDLHPWKLWSKDGTPGEDTNTIVRELETVLERDPQHIGANHFYIHAVEASRKPDAGLQAAKRMASLAPASGHLVHMPGHIFIRTGDHAASLETNRQAVAMDEAFFERTNSHGAYTMYYVHNLHFVAVEAAMIGRTHESLEAAKKIHNAIAQMAQSMPDMADGFLNTDLMIAARQHAWNYVAHSTDPGDKLPMARFIWHYARAHAFAAQGKLAPAHRERAAMAALKSQALKSVINPAAPDATANFIKMCELTADAELAPRGAQREKLLRQAVSVEDAMAYNEPPDWLAPTRELLGSELLHSGKASQAEQVFRDELAANARNPRALFGLAESLKAQHKPDTEVRQQFEQAWSNADRPLTLAQL